MATEYRSWAETEFVRSATRTGSMSAGYDELPVAIHAVEEVDRVVAPRTLCGSHAIRDEHLGGLFGPN